MKNIYYMYNVPTVLARVQRRGAQVQETGELKKVDQHMEEVSLVTQTHSEIGYVSSMMMMVLVFGTRHYNSEVGQSLDIGT